MKIGIIGAGSVGGALGQRWATAGHEINFGVRNTSKTEVLELLKSIGQRSSAASIADAAAFAEVVLLATP